MRGLKNIGFPRVCDITPSLFIYFVSLSVTNDDQFEELLKNFLELLHVSCYI